MRKTENALKAEATAIRLQPNETELSFEERLALMERLELIYELILDDS